MLLIPLSDAHDHYKNCTMILNNSNNCCYNYDNRNNIRITKDNNEKNKNYRNTTNNKNYKYHQTFLKLILINFILLLEIVHVGSNSHVLSKCRQTCETYSKVRTHFFIVVIILIVIVVVGMIIIMIYSWVSLTYSRKLCQCILLNLLPFEKSSFIFGLR